MAGFGDFPSSSNFIPDIDFSDINSIVPSVSFSTTLVPYQTENLAGPSNFVTENPNTFAASSLPGSSNMSCDHCLVLRTILHFQNLLPIKLEIHGTLGLIYHAVLYHGDDKIKTIDLSSKSFEEIQNFLKSYFSNQAQLGYTLVSDPMVNFYETLSVGLQRDQTPNISIPKSNIVEGTSTTIQERIASGSHRQVHALLSQRRRKSTYAAKRERILMLKLQDFKDFFHLPLSEASKRMDLAASTIREIYKREGLSRWPYKKINFLLKHEKLLRSSLSTMHGTSKDMVLANLDKVRHEIIEHCGGIVPTAMYLD